MEALVPVKVAAAPPSTFSSTARRVLLVSDDDSLIGAAIARGWLTRRLGVAEFLDDGASATVAAVTQLSPDLLVMAVGFRHAVSPQALVEVKGYAKAALAFTAGILRSCASISIVGVRRPESLLPSLFDGVLLTAVQEAAELRYAVLVVEGQPSPALMEMIESVAAGTELRYRFDGRTLWAEHLAPMVRRPPGRPVIRRGGHYLVLGGAGGIGISLIGWLSRQQGAQVSVMGRSALTAALRARLGASGAIGYAAADASRPDQFEEAWDQLASRRGRVDGVFHLAGAIDDALILAPRPVDLDRVFDAKVGGALNLWRAQTRHAPDFICNFTSLSGRIGNAGQASYAAANAFVDALTVHCDGDGGTRWRAVNWGLWASDGMSVPTGTSTLTPMRPADACDALEEALTGRDPVSVVFSGTLPVTTRPEANGSGGGSTVRSSEADQDRRNASRFVGPSAGAEATAAALPSREAIGDWVAQIVCRFSGLRNLGHHDNLIALGVDSVAGINIANEIGRRLAEANDKRVSKALIFEYPTISEIVDHLASRFVIHLQEAGADVTRPGVAHRMQSDAGATPTSAASTVSEQPSRPSPREQDIAIVGIAGEFPGADSLEQLYRILQDGVNAVTVVPEDRWSWREDYSTAPDAPGKTYGRHGGFIARAKQFDPAFFGISPADAPAIDPQERRFLQMAYHALEDAGHFAVNEVETGVFVAAMFNHYQDLDRSQDVFGGSLASIANRASYAFNLQGPSMCVDTMCSGSLTALHLAINSIRLGECRQALVGAANIMPHPGKMRLLAEQRFLSPTGRCHSFGVEADGYVPGEGVIALLIKPLADAVAQSDRVHAVIRGCAINACGRSSGYTVPSTRAQERVIRRALTQACVEPEQIGYVEAHGTGTSLGDPIEIEALSAAYGGNARCLVGSVKSNIGHLEAAAGLAGLAKIVLQFRHDIVFPTLNCRLENPLLDLAGAGLTLARQAQPWNRDGAGRFASLSSFGAGGANAHVIVADHVDLDRVSSAPGPCLIVLSGKTAKALDRRAADLAEWLSSNPGASLYAVGFTLARCREHFRHRRAMVVSTLEELRERIVQSENASDAREVNTDPDLAAARRAYLSHEAVAFDLLFPEPALVALPNYPFDERSYWALTKRQAENLTTPATAGPPAIPVRDRLLFGPGWRPEPFAWKPSVAEGRILVFCDQEHASDWGSVADVVTITLGPVTKLEEGSAVILGDTAQDFTLVLDKYTGASSAPSMLVNMLGMSRRLRMPKDVARTQFALAKALAARPGDHRMVYVHPRAEIGDGGPLTAALAGLFRVLAMEKEGFGTVAVELAGAFDEMAVPTIKAELAECGKGYRACRHVAGHREVSYLREIEPEYRDVATTFRKGGVYLVTGGLGMIGRAIAERLVTKYQATVVLTGRSPRNASVEQRLNRLSALGGVVDYRSVDVTNQTAVSTLVESLLSDHGALHGVIHSAGLLSDGLLRTKTLADFERVLNVKVAGSDLLDRATAHVPLDFFVMFSSISSLFGNVGQADYVVANGYMDRFAALRRERVARGERHGSSKAINWPLWINDDGEMEEYRALAQYMEANFGISPLTPARGVELFLDLLRTTDDVTQVAPLTGNVEQMRRSVPQMAVTVPDVDAKPASGEAQAEEVKALERALVIVISALTGLDRDEVDLDASFGDLGLNSIAIQKMSDRIARDLSLPLPPTALFSHNSVSRLARHVHGRGARVDDTGVPVDYAPVARPQRPVEKACERPTVGGSTSEIPTEVDPGRIAIIGLDGRLPGSEDLDGFWQDLVSNRSCISPMERWPHVQRWGGTIPGVDEFDPKFFGISAREAMLMDPQHRLFLQCSYNALLNAGYAPSSLRNVGVFAGVQFNDYEKLLQRAGQAHHPYVATGNAHAMLANRVSYLFDFEGPSQTVDTACSSALVAINRSVLALRARECDYAVAGAVSLLLDSETTDAASSMGVLSPRARCATFDEEADGYVRAEGVGCVILKRLEDAVRDGDFICAVIESFAENHGGRSNSLTAPNPNAQARLLRTAYTRDLAARVSYIETHGTGTKLGDPVEIDALKAAWADLDSEGETGRIRLGSVKTNVGHLEPAAGIASLLKVILCLKHRLLPANINFDRLNPFIELTGTPFQILAANTRWEAPVPRVAGISSFGFGGTNAHLVLSEAIASPEPRPPADEHELIVLSAKSIASLMRMKERLLCHLTDADEPSQPLADIATTLYDGREHFNHRLAWVVTDTNDLVARLRTTNTTMATSLDMRAVRQGSQSGPPPLDETTTRSDRLVAMRDAYLAAEPSKPGSYPRSGPRRRVPLPGYAFDARRYWFDGDRPGHGNVSVASTPVGHHEIGLIA